MSFTESFELRAMLLAISIELSAFSKNKCRTDGLSFVFTDSLKLTAYSYYLCFTESFELTAYSYFLAIMSFLF